MSITPRRQGPDSHHSQGWRSGGRWEETVPVVQGGTGVDKKMPSPEPTGGDTTPTPIISQRNSALSSQNVTRSSRPFPEPFSSPALPVLISFLADQRHTRKWMRKPTEKEVFSLLPNFWMKFRGWEGGENAVLRCKTHVNERTLPWMLRKPSLTFQLPYTQLNKRPPCPKPNLHSLGRSEPWSNPLVCVCVCGCVCVRARACVHVCVQQLWMVSFFFFSPFKNTTGS